MKQMKVDVSIRRKVIILVKVCCLKTSFLALLGLTLPLELVDLQKIVPNVLQARV